MKIIKLYVEKATPEHLVEEFAMPPFVENPRVVMWGIRHFLRDETDHSVYIETFCYAIPPGPMSSPEYWGQKDPNAA